MTYKIFTLTKNNIVFSLILIVLIFVVAAIFKLVGIAEIPRQFFAALIGAAITVEITNLLLQSQTKSEFDNLKREKIYEEKLHIFQNYLRLVSDLSLKRFLNSEQQVELQYHVSLIAMHMNSDNLKRVLEETNHILESACQTDGRNERNTRRNIMGIVQCFRKELYDVHESLCQLDECFSQLASGATLYNGLPQGGGLPMGKESQESAWEKLREKYEKNGWILKRKNDENHESVGFYNNNKKDFVEVLYDVDYQHYIVRVRCNKSTQVSVSLFDVFGGFRKGVDWWKVMKSPSFSKMPRGNLTKDETYKRKLFYTFDAIFSQMDKNKIFV